MKRTIRLAVGLALFVSIVAAASARGADVTLPFVNGGGYTTVLVINNPGSAAVAVPDFWRPWRIGAPALEVAPRSTFRFAAWPFAGGGVASFDLPAGLDAYAEIEDPNGVRVRIPSIGQALEVASQAQDILTAGIAGADGRVRLVERPAFRTFVFLAAAGDGNLEVRWYQNDLEIGRASHAVAAGQVILQEIPAGNRLAIVPVDPRWSHLVPATPYRGFVLISHLPAGELMTAPLAAIP